MAAAAFTALRVRLEGRAPASPVDSQLAVLMQFFRQLDLLYFLDNALMTTHEISPLFTLFRSLLKPRYNIVLAEPGGSSIFQRSH